jgi:hypothetical protein
MDLLKIEVPETATIHIEHPTMGKLYKDDQRTMPCTIEVYGPASQQAIDQRRKATKRMSERLGKKGLKSLSSLPPEEIEDMEVERLTAMTASVSNIEMGAVVVTGENVDRLYRNPKLGWIRDQVAEKLGSWEDFLA